MFDVFVLSIGQKLAFRTKTHGGITMLPVNHWGGKKPKYYHTLWPTLNGIHGILYKIFPDGELGEEFECGDDLFQFFFGEYEHEDIQQTISDFDYDKDIPLSSTIVPVMLAQEHENAFSAVLDMLLSLSPIRKIMFLCRAQGPEPEIIFGCYPKDKFLFAMKEKRVRTNICYIISESW